MSQRKKSALVGGDSAPPPSAPPQLPPPAAQLQPSWRKDANNIALLILLYALQGIPLGLVMGSVPFLLQAALADTVKAAAAATAAASAAANATTNSTSTAAVETISYSLLGVFALSAWPYSLKLLWSPFVDSWYVPRFGRRKSWIVPVQIAIGAYMCACALHVEEWIASARVHHMTAVFFALVALVATQDIAVDGWAVEILAPENQTYASTAQSVGLNIGFFLSYTVFLGLNSAAFCNRWLRDAGAPLPHGVVSLSQYMWAWGVVYFVVTLGVALLKREAPSESVAADATTHKSDDAPTQVTTPAEAEAASVATLAAASLVTDADATVTTPPPTASTTTSTAAVYRQIIALLCLPNMRALVVLLLTSRVGFAAAENVAMLKLLERGLPREHLGAFALIGFPFELIAPLLAARLMQPDRPLALWYRAFPLRMIMAATAALVVYSIPVDGMSPVYYALILVYQLSYSMIQNMSFVSLCGYFVSVADARVGATYMTLLNTLANLGGTWPKSVALFLVDALTWKHRECASVEGDDGGGACTTTVWVDGYYALTVVCLVVGILHARFVLRPIMARLEATAASEWRCPVV